MVILVVSIILCQYSAGLLHIQRLVPIGKVACRRSLGKLVPPYTYVLLSSTEITRVRFKSLRFLLTNSRVPRDTKQLVAKVGQKKIEVITNMTERLLDPDFTTTAGT